MADINVFELTNMALKNLDTDKTTKKSVSESVKRTSKKRAMKENKALPKISFKKLKLESLKTMNEDDDFEFTPDDEVVLVIDTEMEEVPETEEDAVAAAQELVGNNVCKCSVCGANYICTDNVIEEDVDGEVTMVAEEGVCPICGEEAPQIVVGEIVADVAEEPAEEPEDDEEVETETETETEVEDGEDEFDETEFEVDDEEEVEEACNRKRRPAKKENVRKSMTRRPTMRRESMRKPMKRPTRPAARMESAERNNRPSVRRPATRRTAESAMNRPARRPMSRRTAESAVKRPVRRPINRTSRMAMENKRPTSGVAYNFNEVALNKLFTKFATENYSNVKSVRFTKGSLAKNGNMTLEGVVTTVKGNKRPIKLVAEGIKNVKNGKVMLKARENGPFTESAVKTRNRVPFVVECAVKERTVTPTSMKYAFTTTDSGLKESKGRKGSYKVYGSVK